jgi:hypothetical protein
LSLLSDCSYTVSTLVNSIAVVVVVDIVICTVRHNHLIYLLLVAVGVHPGGLVLLERDLQGELKRKEEAVKLRDAANEVGQRATGNTHSTDLPLGRAP